LTKYFLNQRFGFFPFSSPAFSLLDIYCSRSALHSARAGLRARAAAAVRRGSSRRSGRAQQAGAACSAQIGPRRVRAGRLATRHSPARRERPKGSSSVACGLQASCLAAAAE